MLAAFTLFGYSELNLGFVRGLKRFAINHRTGDARP
jgi:hypothetical protein